MPESPLVQKETVALSDLEALIAARAKGESETELGFRKRIEREEAEYRATAKQLADKYKVDSTAMEAEYSRAREQVVQTFQRDTQATKDEYAQTKKQIDDQFKKDPRRAKKTKEETGWQALAMFEGQRDEGIKWRRGTDANWHEELGFFQQKQAEAEFVLKRCGRLAQAAGRRRLPPRPIAAGRRATAPSRRPRRQTPQRRQPTTRRAAAEPAEPPAEADPARHASRTARAHRRSSLIALEALKLPKFLQIDTFIWPFLLLGGRWPPGWASAPSVGWTTAGIAGAVAARGIGSRGLHRPELDGTPERGAARRPAAEGPRRRRAARRAEQGLDQDQVRRQAQGAREEARDHGPRRRGAAGPPRRRVPGAGIRNRPKRPTRHTRRGSSRSSVSRDEGLKKAEEHYPPRIAALKEKYEKDRRELDESYRKTKETTKQHYDQAWSNLIKNWTEGMARVDQTVRRSSRRGRAPVPRLDQARARRLEAADRGPARHAVRRLRRRSRATSPTASRSTRG